MPLTPFKSASHGAWATCFIRPRPNLRPVSTSALPQRFPISRDLSPPSASTPSIFIHAHVQSALCHIMRDGQQTIKWLAVCAAQRYGLRPSAGQGTKQGNLQHRPPANGPSSSERAPPPSTNCPGGSHSVGSFVPLDLEKAQRRKRRRKAHNHVSEGSPRPRWFPRPVQHDIMWRASSIESKNAGTCGGGRGRPIRKCIRQSPNLSTLRTCLATFSGMGTGWAPATGQLCDRCARSGSCRVLAYGRRAAGKEPGDQGRHSRLEQRCQRL